MSVILWCFLGLTSLVNTQKLPSDITICHRNDPKISECIAKAMADTLIAIKPGIKDLKVPPLEPFYVQRLSLIQSKTNKNFQLSMAFVDSYARGLSKTTFSNIKADVSDDYINIKGEVKFHEVIFDGKYEMYGKLLLFTLKGNDKFHAEFTNMKGNLTLILDTNSQDSDHYTVKNALIEVGKPDGVVMKYDNLVKGNPKLSDQINKLLVENAGKLHDAFKPSIDDFFTSIFLTETSKIFSIVPKKDILLP